MLADHPFLAAALGGTLETALARWLALDPRSPELLKPLAGRTIAVQLRPSGTILYLCPTEAAVQVLAEIDGSPDITLSGTMGAFARQLRGSSREGVAAGGIEIEGDAELARRFQNLFEKLNVDFETPLARYTGPVLAATLMDGIRSGIAWTRGTFDTLCADLAEFWQEESRELPSRPEVEAFYTDVDTLRADSDRLEARIQRLEARSAPRPTLP